MPIEVMFEETVRLLAAALDDPRCSPARISHLEYEAGRLRRTRLNGWRIRDRKPVLVQAVGRIERHAQSTARSGSPLHLDDEAGALGAGGVNQLSTQFYGRAGGREARNLRRHKPRSARLPRKPLALAPITISGCRATHCDGCLEALSKAQVHEHHGVLGVTFHLHRAECLAEARVRA